MNKKPPRRKHFVGMKYFGMLNITTFHELFKTVEGCKQYFLSLNIQDKFLMLASLILTGLFFLLLLQK